MINLDNNLMLKSENIEYNNDTLKNILDNLTFEDVTSQFTFVNCTFNSGKIYKFGKLVFIVIKITPTQTSTWADIIQNIPNYLLPLAIHDNGQPIVGTSFWVYGGNAKNIYGAITKDKKTTVTGYYILQD